GQDRGEGGGAREVRRVPAGRSRGPAAVVRGDSGADRPPVPGPCLGLSLVAPDQAVRTSSPCVRGASREPMAEAEERRRGWCGGLSLRRSESRQHFLGEKSLQSHLRGANISRWRYSRGPKGGPSGKDRAIYLTQPGCSPETDLTPSPRDG